MKDQFEKYIPKNEENPINMADLASFTYNCPTCGKSVTATAPRELLDKTECECNICRMEKNGTMGKIVAQNAERKKTNQELGIKE